MGSLVFSEICQELDFPPIEIWSSSNEKQSIVTFFEHCSQFVASALALRMENVLQLLKKDISKASMAEAHQIRHQKFLTTEKREGKGERRMHCQHS